MMEGGECLRHEKVRRDGSAGLILTGFGYPVGPVRWQGNRMRAGNVSLNAAIRASSAEPVYFWPGAYFFASPGFLAF
jgi:hypothetical protein